MRIKIGYIVLLLFLFGCSKTDTSVMTKESPQVLYETGEKVNVFEGRFL